MRKTLFLIVLILAALSSICLGLRLNGSPEYQTYLGRVAVSFHPDIQGKVEVYTPLADWGVSADAFQSPASIRIEPRALNRPALLQLAGKPSSALVQTEKDLRGAVIRSGIQAAIWVLFASILLALPVWFLAQRLHLPGRWALAVPLGSLLCSVVVAFAAWISFRPDAFQDPTYWAKGSELPQLIDFARGAHKASRSYESSVGRGIRELAGVLSGQPAGIKTEQSMILMSDLHNNLLALDSVQKITKGHPVFFVGDFAHEGGRVEQELLTPYMHKMGDPLFAVSGNHDSQQLMRQISRAGGIVLGEEGQLNEAGGWNNLPVYDYKGWRIMGLRDPLESINPEVQSRNFSLSQEEQRDTLSRWIPQIRQNRPQILLVHQSGLAEQIARQLHDQPITILTGHDHKQHIHRYGKAWVIDAGTVGAGGLLGAGRQYVGLAKLYFGKDHLQAVDMIRLEPIRGTGVSQRVVLSGRCQKIDQLKCRLLDQSSADHP